LPIDRPTRYLSTLEVKYGAISNPHPPGTSADKHMLLHKVVALSGVFLFVSLSEFAQGSSRLQNWQAPTYAARQPNPVVPDKTSLTRGSDLFSQMCSYCHGEHAHGQSAEAAGTDTPPPNLVTRLHHYSQGDFHWKIKIGRGEMPPFMADLSDEEIWDIINYISTLP